MVAFSEALKEQRIDPTEQWVPFKAFREAFPGYRVHVSLHAFERGQERAGITGTTTDWINKQIAGRMNAGTVVWQHPRKPFFGVVYQNVRYACEIQHDFKRFKIMTVLYN